MGGEHKAPCSAVMVNTFDADVHADVDGSYAVESPPPAGCVAIIDAEGELVCYAPNGKATALVAWLNWSSEHAPSHYDVCEPGAR